MTPALMRSQKVSVKSGRYKEVDTADLAFEISKRAKELAETQSYSHEEIGELLFTISALCGKEEIDAEKALFDKTNSYIEEFKN